jgi:hypothetical protein
MQSWAGAAVRGVDTVLSTDCRGGRLASRCTLSLRLMTVVMIMRVVGKTPSVERNSRMGASPSAGHILVMAAGAVMWLCGGSGGGRQVGLGGGRH